MKAHTLRVIRHRILRVLRYKSQLVTEGTKLHNKCLHDFHSLQNIFMVIEDLMDGTCSKNGGRCEMN